MTRIQAMRHIVMPQAFRNMTPILLTQSIILFQDTSLVYVVTLRDFMTSASTVANQELRLVELYAVRGRRVFHYLLHGVACRQPATDANFQR